MKYFKLKPSKEIGIIKEIIKNSILDGKIKNDKEFVSKREEILTMIWDMEEEIMGKEN